MAELELKVQDLERQRDLLRRQVCRLQRFAQAGCLTGGLAHEILNQLSLLMGTAELGLQMGDAATAREGLEAVLCEGGRMHETVEAFLGFMQGGRERVRRLPVAEALARLEDLVSPVAKSKGVSLLVSCASRAAIEVDAQMIDQAFVNLAVNGIRAAARGGGRLVVSASDGRRGDVRIVFRDTGPGIRDDVRRGLFRPFVTGHQSEGGTGLGLYVVRQVVQRYEGRITVESCASGTRVEVCLPTSSPPNTT